MLKMAVCALLIVTLRTVNLPKRHDKDRRQPQMTKLAVDFPPTSHISLEKQYQLPFWLSTNWNFTSVEDEVPHETTTKKKSRHWRARENPHLPSVLHPDAYR